MIRKKLFLKAKDIQRLENVSINTAYKYLNELKAHFNKKRITFFDYCNYWNIEGNDKIELLELLN